MILKSNVPNFSLTSKTKGEIGLKWSGDEVFFFKTCLPRTLIHFLSGYYSTLRAQCLITFSSFYDVFVKMRMMMRVRLVITNKKVYLQVRLFGERLSEYI